MAVACQLEQSLLAVACLGSCKGLAHHAVEVALEALECLLGLLIVVGAYLCQQHFGSVIASDASQSLDGSLGHIAALLDGLYQQRLLTGQSVLAQPVDDIHLALFLTRRILLGHLLSQFVIDQLVVCGVVESLHAQCVILALEGLHHLVAGLVTQLHQLVISLGIYGCTGVGGIGHVVLLGEHAQLSLEELLCGLVGSFGDGVLQTLGHCLAVLCVGRCKVHCTADGILYHVVGMLLGGLQHGSQHLDGDGCGLYQRLHLAVVIGL